MSNIERMYTSKEAARLLGCASRTVRRICQKWHIASPRGSSSRRGVYLLTEEELSQVRARLAEYKTVRVTRKSISGKEQ